MGEEEEEDIGEEGVVAVGDTTMGIKEEIGGMEVAAVTEITDKITDTIVDMGVEGETEIMGEKGIRPTKNLKNLIRVCQNRLSS